MSSLTPPLSSDIALKFGSESLIVKTTSDRFQELFSFSQGRVADPSLGKTNQMLCREGYAPTWNLTSHPVCFCWSGATADRPDYRHRAYKWPNPIILQDWKLLMEGKTEYVPRGLLH